MADTLPKLLQEIHSIRTASELQSQLSSLRARIAALRTDETSIIYAANHTTRELNNKLFNFGLESELDLTQLDGGLRPILSSSGGGGGISNPTYSITLNAGANTTLTSTKTSAQSGESVTITATANNGYTLTSFQVDGSERTSPYTFNMPARNISSSTTAEALTLNAPSLTTSAGDYVFDYYNSPDNATLTHDEDAYKSGDTYEDYHYSITVVLTAEDNSTISNNGGTITSYEFSYSTDEGTNWTVLQDTSSKTFSHRFGQSSGVKWMAGQAYKVGQIVHHGEEPNQIEYEVKNDHTSVDDPTTDTTNYSSTGFKIENFLGIDAYAPWYRVKAKNSIGYESDASTTVKYGFINDTTNYFIQDTYWLPNTSTDINTFYTHLVYMNHKLAANGKHDSDAADNYGAGTVVHTASTSSPGTKNASLRWEDPNFPRTREYLGGNVAPENLKTGNWGWFAVTDYLNGLATNGGNQTLQFVKFDIDDS
jgi:hypothetical protein